MRSRRVVPVVLSAFLLAAPCMAQDSPPAPQRIRIGGNVQQARLLAQPRPVYPPLAKQARIQGTVRLQVVIGKDGAVLQVEVQFGHPLLVESAIEAVRQWRYQPTLLNGRPVEVLTTVDVIFTLSGNPPEPPGSADERRSTAATLNELRGTLRENPASVSTRHQIALLLMREHDHPGALAEVREIVRISPADTRSILHVGSILYRQGNASQAVLEIDDLVRNHSAAGEIRRGLAVILAGVRHFGAARLEIERARELEPENPETLKLQPQIASGLAKLESEMEEVHRKLREDPKAPGRGKLARLMFLHDGDLDGAISEARSALDLDHNEDALALAALLQQRYGTEHTLAEMRALESRFPRSSAIRVALADLLLHQKENELAKQVLQKALEIAPGNSLAAMMLSQAEEGAASRRLPPAGQSESPDSAAEAAAIGALRTINTASVVYSSTYGAFPSSLGQLGPDPRGGPASAAAADLIVPSLAAGMLGNYSFIYIAGGTDSKGRVASYQVRASPISAGGPGKRFFYTDQSGVIRFRTSGPAGPNDPPIS